MYPAELCLVRLKLFMERVDGQVPDVSSFWLRSDHAGHLLYHEIWGQYNQFLGEAIRAVFILIDGRCAPGGGQPMCPGSLWMLSTEAPPGILRDKMHDQSALRRRLQKQTIFEKQNSVSLSQTKWNNWDPLKLPENYCFPAPSVNQAQTFIQHLQHTRCRADLQI